MPGSRRNALTRLLPDRPRLALPLVEIPYERVTGIYGADKRRLPPRMRWLAPDAAASFLERLADTVIVSDMYRSAESSLAARKARRGAKRPGYSGHNYGYSIDLDVSETLRREFPGRQGKRALDRFMERWGWYCHRRDHKRDFEDWHYNYGIKPYLRDSDRRTSHALERRIVDVHGRAFELSDHEIQIALAELGLYGGAIDGIIGELSREATRAFQRAWTLRVDGKPGPVTQRTLAFVTAIRIETKSAATGPACSSPTGNHP